MREHWLVEGKLHTTHGIRNPEELRKVDGLIDEADGRKTHWIEFWDEGELVHRSVWVGADDGE